MSDLNLIKPPRIAIASEASAGHRLIGPARTDARPIVDPRQTAMPTIRRAGGQFGTTNGVQINRRSEAPVTRLAPQTISVLTSTLGNLVKFCKAEGATEAAALAKETLKIVQAIAEGRSIADRSSDPHVDSHEQPEPKA